VVFSKLKNVSCNSVWLYFHVIIYSVTETLSLQNLKGRIGITSTVYEVGSCNEPKKTETYVRCKRSGYKGFIVFVHVENQSDAVDELLGHCKKKGLKNVARKSSSSSAGWAYAVGLKI